MEDNSDEYYMRRCLDLAQKAKGHTAPNPMVGAVLVYNDRVVGQGWHHYYGADHAEVNCLKNVPESDKHLIPESVMYVNLEPCAHHGITPPCANRIVEEQIKRVVIANTDPFDQVSGRGIEILEQDGVTVETGMLEMEGKWVNRRFFCFHSQKRPYIILKWAKTKEGFIAPADLSRIQITGAATQQLVHRWRTEEGAIIVGSNTAMNDNPQLTSRLWPGKQPLRIAIDRKVRLPATHHLFDNTAATWIINDHKETLEGNVHHVMLRFDDTLLSQLMERLYHANILSLIVEGGAELLTTFVRQGLWDEARIFTGNTVIPDGIPAPSPLNENVAFTTTVGEDLLQLLVNKNSDYQHIDGLEL